MKMLWPNNWVSLQLLKFCINQYTQGILKWQRPDRYKDWHFRFVTFHVQLCTHLTKKSQVSSYSQNVWFFLPDLIDRCLDNRKVKYTPAHIALLIFHSCEHMLDSARMQTQILGMPLPIKIECSEIEMFNRCFILGKKAICNFNLRFCLILCTGIQERWKQLFWYLLQVQFLKYMWLLKQLRPLLSYQTFLKNYIDFFFTCNVCVILKTNLKSRSVCCHRCNFWYSSD